MIQRKDFQIERRVKIISNAMTLSEQRALARILQDKEHFIEQTKMPGMTQKLPGNDSLYSMKFGKEMRILYTLENDHIIVQDILHNVTFERFVAERKMAV